MKELRQLYDQLSGMQHDLQSSNYSVSLQDKLEILGRFAETELEDVIRTIDSALDRISELEDELNEANDRIDELERELSEAV